MVPKAKPPDLVLAGAGIVPKPKPPRAGAALSAAPAPKPKGWRGPSSESETSQRETSQRPTRASGDSGAPIAWDRISATTDCVVQRMWRTGEWLYITGLFRGTVQAVVSPAFGGGLTATGMQDAFVVRLRIPS